MRTSLAVFLLLLSSGPAFGAPVFYASRAAFDAAAGGGLSLESFEVAPPS